jgi:pimeloyl-ACP methyl ester carboxylesterase
MTEAVTHTLEVPGAVLRYDVRKGESANAVPLVMIGSPMGAAGFAALASHFPDRTVVTYDPRGVERSERADASAPTPPELHAADVRAVIADAVGDGPVDVFASSGGAVNSLALVAESPDLVRTLVAHEPPTASLLPDAKEALAACQAIHETYEKSGFGAGMAHFIALISISGPIPADFADQPGPDPAMFGMPTEDDGTRGDLLLGTNMLSTPHYLPDGERLRAASTRIVIGIGADSHGELAQRGGEAVAELLGSDVVKFPGGHGGFMGDAYGQQAGEHEAFAVVLGEVLAG